MASPWVYRRELDALGKRVIREIAAEPSYGPLKLRENLAYSRPRERFLAPAVEFGGRLYCKPRARAALIRPWPVKVSKPVIPTSSAVDSRRALTCAGVMFG